MIRWFYLLEEANKNKLSSDLPISYVDIVYAFFQNCYHLKDWIINYKLKSKEEVDNFIIQSDFLQICADICNGSKHFQLKNSKSKLNISVAPEFCNKPLREMAISFYVNGIFCNPLEIATECIKEWDTFLGKV